MSHEVASPSAIIRRVTHLQETPSTNSLALESKQDGLVFIAEAQTAGRGQHGRAWHSAPSRGIWLSVCLQGPPQGLNFAAPLAVRDALDPVLPVRIKWPNDILHQHRKLCGILIEHRAGWNAVGIGLNVNHLEDDFPLELRGTATSLRMALRAEQDKEFLLDSLLTALDMRLAEWRAGRLDSLYRQWAESCVIMGEPVCRGAVSGIVAGLRADGALLLRVPDGNIVALTGWPAMDEME